MSEIDVRNSKYFKTLPKLVQESIMQSGVKFSNEDEVRLFVSGIDNAEDNML